MQRICADSALMRFTLRAMLRSADANESSFFLEKRKKNKTEMTFRLIGCAKYDKIDHSFVIIGVHICHAKNLRFTLHAMLRYADANESSFFSKKAKKQD